VGEAHTLGYYTNLITSGIGLTEERIKALKDAGLDHIQLSFQDSTREVNDFLSSTRTFELKSKVAALIKKYDYPMVMNCVLHRHNLPHVDKIIDMALELDAEYLELANTQYLGWALANRDALLPSRAALAEARALADEARARLRGRVEILFVRPDYYADRPRACMDGWARRYLVVTPSGTALPCHQAGGIPGLSFGNVRDASLEELWTASPGFLAFRGEAWMPEPCRSCDERDIDFGGCRCQALALLGDPAATDPACARSPSHDLVLAARKRAEAPAPAPATEAPLRLRRLPVR